VRGPASARHNNVIQGAPSAQPARWKNSAAAELPVAVGVFDRSRVDALWAAAAAIQARTRGPFARTAVR